MKKPSVALLLFWIAAAIVAAPLFIGPSESKWSVASGTTAVATVTMITDGRNQRVEWKPAVGGATTVFLASSGKLWARITGGDIELGSYKGTVDKLVVPALLLPVMTAASDKVTTAAGKVSSYKYGSTTAAYKHDKSGPSAITITAGGKTYTLTRTSFGKPSSTDATFYAVKPKKTATSKLARLAGSLSSSSSDTSVSANAGTRGVDPKFRLTDGGNYEALEKIESRDESTKLDLAGFQKSGKVGQAQEEE